MTTIEALTSRTGDDDSLYYAVRRQDLDTCRALNWAWTSIEPFVLSSGPAEDTVYTEAVQRAGHDDVVMLRKGGETETT